MTAFHLIDDTMPDDSQPTAATDGASHAGVDDAIVGPVTLLRIPAVNAAHEWVERGVNVEVTGTRVSGKSSFLSNLHTVLAEADWTVVRIDGLRTLRDHPLEALAVAGLIEIGRPLPPVAAIVDRLSHGGADQRITVLIDDVDCLDRTSCGVLESLTRRMPLQIVTTGPLRSPDPADRSIFRVPHPCAELTLRPWRFEELNGLLTDKFDQVVDPWLAGRIHQLSGGVPGFALALLEAGEMEKRLSFRDEVLSGVGNLWYEGLPRIVEDYIGPLPAGERATLESLSAWGPLSAAEACRLVPPDHLRALEQRKLLTVVHTGHHATVVVFPPLVSEYLNHHRGDLNLLLNDQPIDQAIPETRDVGVPHIFEPENSGALSRLLLARREADGHRLSSTWKKDPTATTATPYINWLVNYRDSRELIDDVRADTRWEKGDDRERVIALMDLARWEAVAGRGLKGALGILTGREGETGPFAPLLDHVALQLHIIDGDVPEYDEALVPIRDDMPPSVQTSAWATRAYLALVTGEVGAAAAAAESITWLPSHPRTVLVKALALCANGDVVAGLAVARAALDVARSTQDNDGIYVCGYATAYALQRLGRRQEAADVIDLSLSLGRPRPDLEPFYQAQLTLATRLAMQATDGFRAKALGQQTRALRIVDGPLPAMTNIVGSLAGETGTVREIPQDAWHRIEAMWNQRYRYAAITTGLWATETVPDAERARGVLDWIHKVGADNLIPSGKFVVALAARDPEKLMACAADLTHTGWPSRAAVALSFAEEWFHVAGKTEAAHDAKTDLAHLLAMNPGVEMDLSLRQLPSAQLSDREREVVALIARGLSNRQIADELVLSVRTVENHVYRAFRKTRLTSRSQLGKLAL